MSRRRQRIHIVMIDTRHRFHGQNAVRRVQRTGQSVHTADLTLRYLRTQRPQGYRVGVVVSKKVSKSAVRRNRIRRRVHELLRAMVPDRAPHYDILVIARNPEVATKPAENLRKEVDILLGRAQFDTPPASDRAIVEAQRKT